MTRASCSTGFRFLEPALTNVFYTHSVDSCQEITVPEDGRFYSVWLTSIVSCSRQDPHHSSLFVLDCRMSRSPEMKQLRTVLCDVKRLLHEV